MGTLAVVVVLPVVVAVSVALALRSGDAGDAGDRGRTTTPATSTPTTSTPPSTISPPDSAPASSGSPGLAALQALNFSIAYPVGWTVERQDVVPAGANYRDTTIKRDLLDPHYVVRVDVSPAVETSKAVNDVVAGLSKNPSFRVLTRRPISLTTSSGTYDAIYLEFLMNHPDTGVLMHTVDILFSDNRGRSFAVLTRAPESDYSNLVLLFERVRSSFAPR